MLFTMLFLRMVAGILAGEGTGDRGSVPSSRKVMAIRNCIVAVTGRVETVISDLMHITPAAIPVPAYRTLKSEAKQHPAKGADSFAAET